MDKTFIWNAVSKAQLVAWWAYDNRLCFVKRLRPAPLPWGLISQN